MPFLRYLILSLTLSPFLAVAQVTPMLNASIQPGKLYLQTEAGFPHKLTSIAQLQQYAPDVAAVLNQYGLVGIAPTFKALHDDPVLGRSYTLTLQAGFEADAIAGVEALRSPVVEFIEAVPHDRHFLTPNDPDFNGAFNRRYHLELLEAEDAWDISTGDSNIVIAIVDDAMRITHEDLEDNVWTNTGEVPNDGIDNDNNGYVDDLNGWDAADNDNNVNPPNNATSFNFSHGTHCGGIAGARTNNADGIASISWNVRLMPCKTKLNSSTGPSLQATLGGVEYAIASGADVISMSYGSSQFSQTVQNAFNRAHNDGIVLIAAAGNDNDSTIQYPAGYTHVIAVASTNASDQRSGFSSYGSWVDVSAPGSNIFSTLGQINNNFYGFQSGTSMATPMVAGLAALMLSYQPNLTPDQIETCLESSADNIYTIPANTGFVGQLGSGRVNAFQALACVVPPQRDNDVVVREVLRENNSLVCRNFVSPEIVIENGGQLPLTSTELSVSIGNQAPVQLTWTGSLDSGFTDTLVVPGVYVPFGELAVTVTGSLPNGVPDENPFNNEAAATYFVLGQTSPVPYLENNAAIFSNSELIAVNPDNSVAWSHFNFVNGPDGTSGVASMPFEGYNQIGAEDHLIMQPVDLGANTDLRLRWQQAYAANGSDVDTLLVMISSSCGATFDTLVTYTSLDSLPTVTPTVAAGFVPATADWAQRGNLSLDTYAGQEVVIAFVAQNGGGNNLFLDDIEVVGTPDSLAVDFSVSDSVLCLGDDLTLINASGSTQTGLTWSLDGLGGSPVFSDTLTLPALQPGVYNLSLTSATGTRTRSVVVAGNPILQLSSAPDVVCAGNEVDLIATGATAGTWFETDDNTVVSGVGLIQSTFPTATSSYYFVGSNLAGCTSTDTLEVDVTPFPADFSFQVQGRNTSNQIIVDFTDVSPGAISWSWRFGDGAFSLEENPTHLYSDSGEYIIRLTVDNGECSVEIRDTIQVDAPVGLLDGAVSQEVSLYPNPSSDAVTVVLPTTTTTVAALSLTDVTGRNLPISARRLADELLLDVSSLPAGLYVLTLQTDEGHHHARLQVQR